MTQAVRVDRWYEPTFMNEALMKALDEIGVEVGETFLVSKPSLASHDQDQEGASHGEPTSKAAGKVVKPRTGTKRHAVLEYLTSCGIYGATADEVAAQLGERQVTSGSSAGKRLTELVKDGFARQSPRTRKTRTGTQATVIVATDAGRAAIEEARRDDG